MYIYVILIYMYIHTHTLTCVHVSVCVCMYIYINVHVPRVSKWCLAFRIPQKTLYAFHFSLIHDTFPTPLFFYDFIRLIIFVE